MASPPSLAVSLTASSPSLASLLPFSAEDSAVPSAVDASFWAVAPARGVPLCTVSICLAPPEPGAGCSVPSSGSGTECSLESFTAPPGWS